ncbi:hypothetical protein V8C40DRAFT_16141 [Trichoderma camerunense]
MSYAGKKSWRSDFWLLFRLLGGLAILLHDDDDIRQQEKKHLFYYYLFLQTHGPPRLAHGVRPLTDAQTHITKRWHHFRGAGFLRCLYCYWTS